MTTTKAIELTPLHLSELPALAEMGRQIWRRHYTPIIGEKQVAYMIERFQSEEAVRRQLEQEHYLYYFLTLNGQRAGYMGIQPGPEGVYLSKLYILEEFRGHGLAKAAFHFLIDLCKCNHWPKIWLTVNKYNPGSIAAYEKLGMTRTREQVADIGGGFVMDDYIYEFPIN